MVAYANRVEKAIDGTGAEVLERKGP
jgi:hypothetical protein